MSDDLIGRKANLIVGEREIGGKVYPTYTLDDPAFVKEMKERFGPSVRIFEPGTGGTMDYVFGRQNIYLDKNGVVKQTSIG